MLQAGHTTRTLLAAPVGIMGSSLRTFLRTIPTVLLIGQAESQAEALAALALALPDILVLDADLAGGGLAAFLRALRAAAPTLNLIVLAESGCQQATALAAGASHALLKGHLDEQLRRAVAPANQL